MLLKTIQDTTFGQRSTSAARGVGAELEAYEVTGGTFVDVEIGEGEMFLLPGQSDLAILARH